MAWLGWCLLGVSLFVWACGAGGSPTNSGSLFAGDGPECPLALCQSRT